MKNPRRGGNRWRGQIRSNLQVELPSHDGSVEGSFGRRRPSRGHPSATTWGGVRCIDRSTGRSGSPAPWAPLCCFGLLPKANDFLAPCLSPRRVLWAHWRAHWSWWCLSAGAGGGGIVLTRRHPRIARSTQFKNTPLSSRSRCTCSKYRFAR